MGLLKGKALFFLLLVLVSAPAYAESGPDEPPPSVCISCHQSLGGEFAEPVALWETSIHRRMGNNCEGCHGGDPNDEVKAMDPKAGFLGAPKPAGVAAFCGRCHVGVKENYVKSVHYTASLQGRGPNCITCHHSHDVQKASFDLIQEPLCSRCHSYENAQKIKKAFVSAELALQNEREALHYLARRGMPVKRLEEKLFAMRNSLHQMTHTLDLPEIQNKTADVLKELEAMNREAGVLKERIYTRWVGGILAVVFLIALIVVLFHLLKTYELEEEER